VNVHFEIVKTTAGYYVWRFKRGSEMWLMFAAVLIVRPLVCRLLFATRQIIRFIFGKCNTDLERFSENKKPPVFPGVSGGRVRLRLPHPTSALAIQATGSDIPGLRP